MIRKTPFLLLAFISFFYSCVSLSEVHTYAAASGEALSKLNSVEYSFNDYCRQDCELQQMRIGEIRPDFACNCEGPAKNADLAIQKIHATISAYLKAVEQLSNNKGFSYDVSGLAEAVQKNSLLGLSEKQVSLATKAGNFISTAATSYYRQKKLGQYLGQADSTFSDLTETFIYLVDNRLRAQLKFQYDARIPNIRQMLDNTTDKGLKQVLVKLYLDEKAYFEKNNALIDTYTRLLRSVHQGHHELYLHRNNLKDVKTKELLKRYTQDLQYIAASVQEQVTK